MRTQIEPYAPPDTRGLGAAQAQFYKLPYFGLGGCTDSKVLDGQAVAEAGLTLLVDALTGANLVHDMGYMESGMTGSLELLAICDDILGWIKRFMDGVEVNRETLALDVIDEVGPDGHFLECEHTVRHYREDFYPELLDRRNYEKWVEQGSKSINDRAREKVAEILAEPVTCDVPDQLAAELRDYCTRAETAS
jgi:trimethylamine--corrinoid protein Co-methyltransferase